MALIPPLGSSIPDVLLINATNLDKAMNGYDDKWVDRGGEERSSLRMLDNIITSLDTANFTFDDKSSGISATTDGQYFRVPQNSGLYSFIYYRNSSGVAIEVAYIANGNLLAPLYRDYYSSASYQSIKRIPRGPLNIHWGVTSGGEWLLAVNGSGTLISTHRHDNYESAFENLGNPVLMDAILNTSSIRIPRGPKRVVSGLVVGGLYRWYLDDDGNYVDGISDESDSVYAPGVVRSDVGTGQSLSLGSRGFINTTPGGAISGQVFSSEPSRHGDLCLMLNGEDSLGNSMGVRVFVNNDNYTPPSIDDFTGVQPIYERWDNGVLGETIWSAYTNALMTFLKNDKNVSFRLLPIVSGKGASTYNSLKRGTNVWDAMFTAIDAAQYLVEERGWIYRVGDLDTMHGEAEINTTQAEYEGYCREWLSDFRTDAVSRTGQTARSIKMTFSQCSTGGTASEGVAAAQVNLHETDTNFVLYCPKYQFPYYDSQHMLAEGYVKTGELRARAKRFMLQGKKWDCLRPVSAVLSGTTLTVKFNNSVSGDVNTAGPIGNLVLDTLRGKNPNGNYGFYISDTSVTILSVAIGTDGSSVDIALSAAPTAGSVVKYAIGETGAGGAVRDSDERDKSSFDNDFIYNFSVGKSLIINQ
ncbi:hypothetical protein [Entomohabitans teleogrylli]|uniref:hypothetical protein n=1 Tax=Entomohabitans teleogrylli TaxID=1384589 RepID=UPI00073D9D22|nr:hypothetical protein [Entomohabitans teleogrylli]